MGRGMWSNSGRSPNFVACAGIGLEHIETMPRPVLKLAMVLSELYIAARGRDTVDERWR